MHAGIVHFAENIFFLLCDSKQGVMIVLCLEGCHGAGKTELLRAFKAVGHRVLGEAFLDMPRTGLHPQSLVMETTWVCDWFRRVLSLVTRPEGAPQLVVVDRSPFSAVLYGHKGHLLESVIRAQIEEVEAAQDVRVVTVYLKVQQHLLWDRILTRLKAEPERERYNEGNVEWMNHVVSFYESRPWTLVVSNDEGPIDAVRDRIVLMM